MILTLGVLKDNNINTLEDAIAFLDKNNISGDEREEFINDFNEIKKLFTEVVENYITQIQEIVKEPFSIAVNLLNNVLLEMWANLKFKLDLTGGQDLDEGLKSLNTVLPDEMKIKNESTLTEIHEAIAWYQKFKEKEFFK